jgi:hypothetical protein
MVVRILAIAVDFLPPGGPVAVMRIFILVSMLGFDPKRA